MGITMIILIVIVGLLVVWFVQTQRQFIHVDELCGNALSQIGVQQSSRWDALTALVQLMKQYSEHEYRTMMDVVGARQGITKRSTAAQVDAQENMITQAMGHMMAIAEHYPELKAQAVYIQTMDGVKKYEEHVRYSRMVYNDTVTKYNRKVRQLPGCLLAGIMGFGVKDYLQEESQKRDMPSMV